MMGRTIIAHGGEQVCRATATSRTPTRLRWRSGC